MFLTTIVPSAQVDDCAVPVAPVPASVSITVKALPLSDNNLLDVGVTTSTTLTGLTNGTLYYVAVTARSTAGLESGRSPVRSIRPHP